MAPPHRPAAPFRAGRASRGEVPEWSIGAVSKTVERVSVPRVRIPPSPPRCFPASSDRVRMSYKKPRNLPYFLAEPVQCHPATAAVLWGHHAHGSRSACRRSPCDRFLWGPGRRSACAAEWAGWWRPAISNRRSPRCRTCEGSRQRGRAERPRPDRGWPNRLPVSVA